MPDRDLATIHHGDCLATLDGLPADSVDAIVTDPPYGLGFMGKAWDDLPPGREWAEACFRVLKPGGHLLAFGGTRTWHRLAVAVEDAGFEIRDSIAWLYGSGFPKSLDVSKAIDKRPGVMRHPEFAADLKEAMRAKGYTNTFDVAEKVLGRRTGAVANWQKYQFPEAKWWPALRDLLDMDEDKWGPVIAETERARTGRTLSTTGARIAPSSFGQAGDAARVNEETAPATDAARNWQGWGTALKPAFEPIVVARKPLTGTVAANVLTHGTGALNIDGCRVDTAKLAVGATGVLGRWPANVVLDESQADTLDQQSGMQPSNARRFKGGEAATTDATYGGAWTSRSQVTHDDKGGASRFFYVAKAPKKERPNIDGTAHPTVKPLTLMRWLVRLVTPPGGTVLDPFAGSGTTVEAAIIEGFHVIGVEREAEYLPLIQHRINRQATGGAA